MAQKYKESLYLDGGPESSEGGVACEQAGARFQPHAL